MSDFDVFERHYTENFATALVVFAARQSQAFAAELLRLILDRAGFGGVKECSVDSIERNFPIQIAGAVPARLPDICIRGKIDGKGCVVLVESKIGAGEGLDQLRDYNTWLRNQENPIAKLATLTRDPLVTRDWPDASLTWSEIVPILNQMGTAATSVFENRFWGQFKTYLEGIMPTFEGFSADYSDVHQLMQEVDLLLISLLRSMGVTKWNSYWNADRAAYWLPEWRATVGFWWWQRFGDATGQNTLIVWRDGSAVRRPVASFQEIIEKAKVAKQSGTIGDFVSKLGQQLRQEYEAEEADA